MAHRTHKRMLGQIKELNLIRDSWVARNRQKYTRTMLKLSHIHRNVEESQKSGALDFFYPTIQRTCHQHSFYNANWLVLNTTWSGQGGCGLSSWLLLTHSGMWSRSRDLFFSFFFTGQMGIIGHRSFYLWWFYQGVWCKKLKSGSQTDRSKFEYTHSSQQLHDHVRSLKSFWYSFLKL